MPRPTIAATRISIRGRPHDCYPQVKRSNTHPRSFGVEFATSADGFPVARIDDTVLAMVTSPSGFAFLASAVFVRRRSQN